MKKHTHINLALLAVIGVLLLFANFSTNDHRTLEPLLLSTINPDSITTIKVIRSDKPTLEFYKNEDGWFMRAPLQIRINKARINAMLRLLNTEFYNQLDPGSAQLTQLGLDKPAIIMQMNEHVFQFGSTDAIDQRRFVLFNNSIYMINDFLYAQLASKPGFFADTRLVPENSTIVAIDFPENRFELVDGEWQMQTLMDIKPIQLKELAFSWEQAEAISVSSYQQPAQDFPITITTADNVSMTFSIIATSPHLVLGRKDLAIQYHMGSDQAARLLLQQPVEAEAQP